MRSRSDNSHVEYYTLQELPSVLISPQWRHSRAPASLCRQRLFVTFILYTLCPRFDSFDSFAMERENAAVWSAERSRLQTTLKFNRTGRIWDRRNFYSFLHTCIGHWTFTSFSVSFFLFFCYHTDEALTNRYSTLMEYSVHFYELRA